MNYKVTKLNIKSKELLIADFSYLNDAKIFINQKISQDEINKHSSLYRIYDDLELVNEFNNGVQTYGEPEDSETYNNARFSFMVKVQSVDSLDTSTVACFNDKADADLFVSGKYSNNDKVADLTSFMIYKDHLLIATLTKNILDNKALKDLVSSGTGQGATLSPLSTRPTPPGGPGDYWKERSEQEE
jgi:hypothetical protein